SPRCNNRETHTRRKENSKFFPTRYLNEPLFRAYLLKEQLRLVFKKAGTLGKEILGEWLQWARRCRIRPFVQLARTITRHRVDIETTLDLGLSNALVESINTKIRLLTRIAFGFHLAE